MSEETKITVEDCEELCNEVINENDSTTNEIYLWGRLWKEIVNKLGQSNNPQFDLFLTSHNPNEPDTTDNIIASTRAEIRKLLEKHSIDSQACMKVFDKLRTTREK